MKEKKLISVIVYLYNNENSILDFLSQITQQAETLFEQFEVIIVNDCSTDNTIEAIENYCKKNPTLPIALFNQETNKGKRQARGGNRFTDRGTHATGAAPGKNNGRIDPEAQRREDELNNGTKQRGGNRSNRKGKEKVCNMLSPQPQDRRLLSFTSQHRKETSMDGQKRGKWNSKMGKGRTGV